MVSPYTDCIDFDEVEKQGLKAIDKDARYWCENDAKFRAVNQKVASYEEFRDIVLASHLKPLEKKDKIDFGIQSRPNAVWNAAANQNTNLKVESSSTGKVNEVDETVMLTKSPMEFYGFWRKLETSDLRYKYLSSFPSTAIGELFQTEMPTGLFIEIVNVLNSECLSESNNDNKGSTALRAVSILQQISQSARFALTLMFLSEKEKTALKALFTSIDAQISVSDSDILNVLKDLKIRYSVE